MKVGIPPTRTKVQNKNWIKDLEQSVLENNIKYDFFTIITCNVGPGDETIMPVHHRLMLK